MTEIPPPETTTFENQNGDGVQFGGVSEGLEIGEDGQRETSLSLSLYFGSARQHSSLIALIKSERQGNAQSFEVTESMESNGSRG